MTGTFRHFLVLSSVTLALATGAGVAAEVRLAAPAKPVAAAVPPYAPGMGDFMTAYVQPHHIKLWLAGSAGNWKVAAYEADELGESFDDVTTYQPKWEGLPVAQYVKAMMDPALKGVHTAIEAKNVAAFKTAYGKLTAACNACHVTTQHEFLEVKTPEGNPYSDQNFAVH